MPYAEVMAIKETALRRAFEHFRRHRVGRRTRPEARDLRAYMDDEHWWLDDYALFRVLHDHHDARAVVGLAGRPRRA